MAGFGFSPQDIVQGIAIAKRICEAHFVRERRAGMHKARRTPFLVAGVERSDPSLMLTLFFSRRQIRAVWHRDPEPEECARKLGEQALERSLQIRIAEGWPDRNCTV